MAASCSPSLTTHAEYLLSSTNVYTFDTKSGATTPYGISFGCCNGPVTNVSVVMYVAYENLTWTTTYGTSVPPLTAGVGKTTGLNPTITAGGVTYYAYTSLIASTDANAATLQWGFTSQVNTTGAALDTFYRAYQATVCGVTLTDGPALRTMTPTTSPNVRQAAPQKNTRPATHPSANLTPTATNE